MPRSHTSTASVSLAETVKNMAYNNALLRTNNLLLSGKIPQNDQAYRLEFETIFRQEYYQIFNQLAQFNAAPSRIIYLQSDNLVTKRYYRPHSPVRFSRTNLLIRVNCTNKSVKLGRFNYPIDKDISPETKEAFLVSWPGPLDKLEDNLKNKITSYIYTLSKHDSHRRIRYCNNDDQRKTILALLIELLRCNGSIDAQSINRLLLRPEQTEFMKEESYRKPLETLQRYLLSGNLIEAVRFSREKKLFDHAQLLSIFYKYQSTGNYNGDAVRLKDDTYVRTVEEFISSIEEQKTLKLIYKSLLNIIIQSDPESRVFIEHPNVGNETYEFAMLSANNCPMEFDQTNEIFKLITCVKQASSDPNSMQDHLISLGYANLDNFDANEDFSLRSHLSFNRDDTFTSRTLKISNIDMLILNEVYEYCLNLVRGTCNPNDYEYIIDLVPYKLVFAAKLFDYGLYDMFSHYINSMQRALAKARHNPTLKRDEFYDWETIEQVVENLSETWALFQSKPHLTGLGATGHPSTISATNNYSPNDQFNSYQRIPNDYQNDYSGYQQNDYTSLPNQGESAFPNYQKPLPSPKHRDIPSQEMNQLSLEPDVNPFELNVQSPEEGFIVGDYQNRHPQQDLVQNPYQQQPYNQSYNDYSNGPSRRESTAASQSAYIPPFSPPSSGPPSAQNAYHHEPQNHKTMTSSSPVNRGNTNKDGQSSSRMVDSFNTPYSPINEHDDNMTTSNIVNSGNKDNNQLLTESSTNEIKSANSSNNANNKQQEAQQQQQQQQQPSGDGSILTNLIENARSIILPKSNSKQMILPDDSQYVYDEKLKRWVDKSKPDDDANGGLDTYDAPPIMNMSNSANNYSFSNNKAPSKRYPKTNF